MRIVLQVYVITLDILDPLATSDSSVPAAGQPAGFVNIKAEIAERTMFTNSSSSSSSGNRSFKNDLDELKEILDKLKEMRRVCNRLLG